MAKLPRRPTTKRGLILTLGVSLATLAVLAFLAIYFVLLPTSSPKPFSLASSAATSASAATNTSSTASRASSAPSAQLSGRWRVAGGSQAGYRVREKLGFLRPRVRGGGLFYGRS